MFLQDVTIGSFGKDICDLISSGAIRKSDVFLLNMFSDEVILDLYVSCALVVLRILG